MSAKLTQPKMHLLTWNSRVNPPFVTGISMHKGYAFVQFANPFDARSACLGEDGRTISGQVVGKYRAEKKSSYVVSRMFQAI